MNYNPTPQSAPSFPPPAAFSPHDACRAPWACLSCPECPRVVWWGRLPFSHTGINKPPSFSVSPPHSAFCSPLPSPPRTAHPLLPWYPEQTPTMDPVHLGCHRLGMCLVPSERDCPFLTVSAQQMFTVKLWERKKRWWDRKWKALLGVNSIAKGSSSRTMMSPKHRISQRTT